MTDVSKVFSNSVPPLSTRVDEVVIPNGEIYRIQRAFGSAGGVGGSSVAVLWDDEVLFLTSNSFERAFTRDLTGDGVKKLVIRLKNPMLSLGGVTLEMQGGYEAVTVA